MVFTEKWTSRLRGWTYTRCVAIVHLHKALAHEDGRLRRAYKLDLHALHGELAPAWRTCHRKGLRATAPFRILEGGWRSAAPGLTPPNFRILKKRRGGDPKRGFGIDLPPFLVGLVFGLRWFNMNKWLFGLGLGMVWGMV